MAPRTFSHKPQPPTAGAAPGFAVQRLVQPGLAVGPVGTPVEQERSEADEGLEEREAEAFGLERAKRGLVPAFPPGAPGAPEENVPPPAVSRVDTLGSRILQQELVRPSPVKGLREPPDEVMRSAAAEGVRTPAGALPFIDRIQDSFGRHPLSHVKAHVGPDAAKASRTMNALAFASGDHVVFGGMPDLRTTAHEAAHIVQQRAGVQLAGGIGRAGDVYEHNADAVADAVVAGRSAERLLGQPAVSPVERVPVASASEGAIQRFVKVLSDGKWSRYDDPDSLRRDMALKTIKADKSSIEALEKQTNDKVPHIYTSWNAAIKAVSAPQPFADKVPRPSAAAQKADKGPKPADKAPPPAPRPADKLADQGPQPAPAPAAAAASAAAPQPDKGPQPGPVPKLAEKVPQPADKLVDKAPQPVDKLADKEPRPAAAAAAAAPQLADQGPQPAAAAAAAAAPQLAEKGPRSFDELNVKGIKNDRLKLMYKVTGEVIESLNKSKDTKGEYMIGGSYAAALRGTSRSPQDVDIDFLTDASYLAGSKIIKEMPGVRLRKWDESIGSVEFVEMFRREAHSRAIPVTVKIEFVNVGRKAINKNVKEGMEKEASLSLHKGIQVPTIAAMIINWMDRHIEAETASTVVDQGKSKWKKDLQNIREMREIYGIELKDVERYMVRKKERYEEIWRLSAPKGKKS